MSSKRRVIDLVSLFFLLSSALKGDKAIPGTVCF